MAARPLPHATRDGKSRPRRTVRIDAMLPSALRALGVASARVTKAVQAAWDLAADPSWRGAAVPERLVGGWLVVAVSSSSLRQELTQFHRDRLVRVLRAALPNVPIAGVRFVDGRALASSESSSAPDASDASPDAPKAGR
jgi:Dna[CI] antecedent DciA-like protein